MIRQNNEDAQRYLFEKFRNLIWNRSHRFYKRLKPIGTHIEDLYQEGHIGYLEAVYSYVESLRVGLAHYVNICVESAMRTALRKCRGKSYGLLDTRLSLDMAICEDGSLLLSDVMSNTDKRCDPLFMSSYQEAKLILDEVLQASTEQEREVYQMRLEGYSYLEISEQLSIRSKLVDNIIQKIKRKIAYRVRDFG